MLNSYSYQIFLTFITFGFKVIFLNVFNYLKFIAQNITNMGLVAGRLLFIFKSVDIQVIYIMRIYLLHNGGIYITCFLSIALAVYIDLYLSMADHEFKFVDINQ